VLQLVDGCISACYQPASVLADVAAELTSSRGMQASESDCVELLRRHQQQVSLVLDQLSLSAWKPSLGDLSSVNVADLCNFSLVSVHTYVALLLLLSLIKQSSFLCERKRVLFTCNNFLLLKTYIVYVFIFAVHFKNNLFLYRL